MTIWTFKKRLKKKKLLIWTVGIVPLSLMQNLPSPHPPPRLPCQASAVFPTSPPFSPASPGLGAPVQVHRAVEAPVLTSHLRDGGRAVPLQRPGAFPVHPVRAQPGQQELRDSPLHPGLCPRGVPTGLLLAGRWFLCPLVSRVREALPGSGLGKGRFIRKYLTEQNAAFTSNASVCWLPGAEPPDDFVPAEEQALFSGACLDCVYLATDY